MQVLVIGAGLAGLSAAHALRAAGHAVIVVDKGRGAGGRLATRRMGDAAFDTGAQFFTVRDPAFAAEIAGWQAAGLVAPWCDGFPVLGRAGTPDGHPRYRAVGGMNRVAKHLAQGLDLRDQRTVTRLTAVAGGWEVTVEPGDLAKPGAVASGPAQTLRADAVVLTAPAPQAVRLLRASGLPVDPAVEAVRYAPCLCLLIDVPDAPGPLLPAPGGLRVEDDAAVSWIASQRAKGLRRTGEGFVVHTTPAWSAERYDWTDERIRDELEPAAEAVLARAGVIVEPAAVQLKKWRFSLPTVTVPTPTVRVAVAAPLQLAGDAYGDRPRVEGAWLSGRAAAAALG